MTRFVGYIATSLDGRIADANGDVDWLTPFNDPATDFGYEAFYADVDALVMGRATYDFLAREIEWPYPGKPCFVVTSHTLSGAPEGVQAVDPDFDALRGRLLSSDHETIWIVGGGQTLRAGLDAGMLDELRVFIIPVVLGGGAALFADGASADATLVGHQDWPDGIIELTYSF